MAVVTHQLSPASSRSCGQKLDWLCSGAPCAFSSISVLSTSSVFVEGLAAGLGMNTESSSYGPCMCLHGICCMTRGEAQAAISQQPLFAPQNEALQDNEHFKTATPTTLTTRLSQHSDIGRERERKREGEGESAGSVKATLSVWGGGTKFIPSAATRLKQHRSHDAPPIIPLAIAPS